MGLFLPAMLLTLCRLTLARAWSIQHLNVPSRYDSTLTKTMRKFK